ncbi:MAG: acyltransferase family protein, partial [Actinomycetota bacterium]
MHTRGFARQPALDGVRAVAVAAVLVFHLGVSWLPGGYLGVSVFFTLSGFLITSLLLHERERAGRIDGPAFYLRRARRLRPGTRVCLAGVATLAMIGVIGERTSLASEMHAAILQFANWDALLSGRSYGALFEVPSPVAHFWSLAIEEQFYLVWPLVMIGLTAWAARRPDRPRATVALTALFVVLAVSAPLTARWWSADAAYFASWARFAEIAAGGALAAVVVRRRVPARAALLAVPCLVAIVGLCVISPAGRGWAYQGGLPLFALLSVGLILGLQVDGPVRRALSVRPLVYVGKVSYGLYLFHWPLFAILDEQRTGLDGPALAAVRLGASLAIAAISFQLVETPLRLGRLLPQTGRYLTGAALAALVVALAATAVPEWERPAGGVEPVVLGATVTAPPTPDTALASASRALPA